MMRPSARSLPTSDLHRGWERGIKALQGAQTCQPVSDSNYKNSKKQGVSWRRYRRIMTLTDDPGEKTPDYLTLKRVTKALKEYTDVSLRSMAITTITRSMLVANSLNYIPD